MLDREVWRILSRYDPSSYVNEGAYITYLRTLSVVSFLTRLRPYPYFACAQNPRAERGRFCRQDTRVS